MKTSHPIVDAILYKKMDAPILPEFELEHTNAVDVEAKTRVEIAAYVHRWLNEQEKRKPNPPKDFRKNVLRSGEEKRIRGARNQKEKR